MPEESETKLRKTAGWLFLVGASIATAVSMGILIYCARREPDFFVVAVRHFPTVVGLPFAAIASLFIVTACRIALGDKLNFKIFGLEFSGAGGPVVLWVLCFLAITLAITTTWEKRYSGPLGHHLSEALDHDSSSESSKESP